MVVGVKEKALPPREGEGSRKKQQGMSSLPCALFSPSCSCRGGMGVATKVKEEFPLVL